MKRKNKKPATPCHSIQLHHHYLSWIHTTNLIKPFTPLNTGPQKNPPDQLPNLSFLYTCLYNSPILIPQNLSWDSWNLQDMIRTISNILLFSSKLSLHIYVLIQIWLTSTNSASHVAFPMRVIFFFSHSSTTEPGDGTHGFLAPVATFRPFSFSYPHTPGFVPNII